MNRRTPGNFISLICARAGRFAADFDPEFVGSVDILCTKNVVTSARALRIRRRQLRKQWKSSQQKKHSNEYVFHSRRKCILK